MTEIFQGTGLTAEELRNNPEAVRTERMTNFVDADIEKAYSKTQGKDGETATYASLYKKVGRKLQIPSSNRQQ